jgi:hypothetical protein
MGRSSPQGLTTQDFHHQSFVNPRDVFPSRSRVAARSQGLRTPVKIGPSSRSPSRFSLDSHKLACCEAEEDEDDDPPFHSSSVLNCCVDLDNHGNPSDCCEEVRHNSPSAMDCEDCVDDCEDCEEEHQIFNQQKVSATVGGFLDDCEECHQEHDKNCTRADCDFSCFDCIDWNEFERDKSLGLSYSVPLLGDSGFTLPDAPLDEMDMLDFSTSAFPDTNYEVMAPPLDIPMHHQCLGNTIPYWSGIPDTQICTGSPVVGSQTQQFPLPPFGLEYGCHPAAAHQQVLLPTFVATTPSRYPPTPVDSTHIPTPPTPASVPDGPLADTKELLSAVSAPTTSRSCQWIMPCGTVCGASFASATDLKKHLKTVHLVKGVVKCGWQGCDSASFASEAALTGHISKKHLAPLISSSSNATTTVIGPDGLKTEQPCGSDEGPFKCTFPGCTKSFMYKQVRDEHVASSHNGNKMYCHICGQFLNGEGSNFKRHMATHRPKHQHMLCKFHGLGCKRRFPRLDNLRRHEACCKFGKKAALMNSTAGSAVSKDVHHHHHHTHIRVSKT